MPHYAMSQEIQTRDLTTAETEQIQQLFAPRPGKVSLFKGSMLNHNYADKVALLYNAYFYLKQQHSTQQSNEITALQQQNQQLQSEIASKQQHVTKQNDQIMALQQKNQQLQSEVTDTHYTLDFLHETIKDIILLYVQDSKQELPKAVLQIICCLPKHAFLAFQKWKNLSNDNRKEISDVLANMIQELINDDESGKRLQETPQELIKHAVASPQRSNQLQIIKLMNIYRFVQGQHEEEQTQHSANKDETVISSVMEDIVRVIEQQAGPPSSSMDTKRPKPDDWTGPPKHDSFTFKKHIDINPFIVRA